MDIEKILGPGGLLAKHLPDYEYRPQQINAAIAIHSALTAKQHCLVEAGTGVGKSMAYLIPAVEYIKRGKKIVISTHTIYLQSQLMSKDIPFIREILPKNKFSAALVKGRSNYLCRNSFDLEYGQLSLYAEDSLKYLSEWINETETGDVAELNFKFPAWNEICSDQDTCHKQDCRFYDKCFYYKMRAIADNSDIIITNHSLFFSDLAIKIENPKIGILPDYDAVVFDEAHHLEDSATKVFSIEYSSYNIPSLISRIKRLKGVDIDLKRLQGIEDINADLLKIFIGSSKQEFFFNDIYAGGSKELAEKNASDLCTLIDGLSVELLSQNTDGKPELKDRIDVIRRICDRFKENLNLLFFGPNDGHFKWGERTKSARFTNCFLRYSPLNVADMLPDSLWKPLDTAILTSATIANSGGFSYLKSRLGIDDCNELIEDSPFDFNQQCILYIPRHLEFPNESLQYAEKVSSEIEQLVAASDGRAFFLFTSYRMMNAVYDILSYRLPYIQLKQGDSSNEELVKEFLSHSNACLYGVHSFWEGIDIKGEALSCVVIDKLPFAAPDSPINKARIDAVTAYGGNGFTEYSIPQAQIRLKQGFGRLIRTKSDKGVVAILDSRLLRKTYGRDFIKNLPKCQITSGVADVRAFFEK